MKKKPLFPPSRVITPPSHNNPKAPITIILLYPIRQCSIFWSHLLQARTTRMQKITTMTSHRFSKVVIFIFRYWHWPHPHQKQDDSRPDSSIWLGTSKEAGPCRASADCSHLGFYPSAGREDTFQWYWDRLPYWGHASLFLLQLHEQSTSGLT